MVVRRSALQRSGDKNAPQALFKPICVQYGFRFFVTEKSKSVSSAAGRPGFQGAALNRFCNLLSAQKDAPAGEARRLKHNIKLALPAGDCKLFHAPAEGICKTHPRRTGVLTKFPKILASPQTSKSPKKSQDEIGKKQQGIGKMHPFPAANVNFR